LFRGDDGAIYVLDFGLARALEDTDENGAPQSALTSADSLLGTVGFMAPEQAQGRWDLVGPQTDLFAVGATLLKLASGLDIHESNTAQGRLVLAATKPVEKTRERAPSLPPELCDVLDRALAFSQKDRFSSAAVFRQALAGQAALSTRGSLAPAAGPIESKRSVRPWTAAILVVLAAGAAAAIATTLSKDKTQIRSAADPTTSATASSATPATTTTTTTAATTSTSTPTATTTSTATSTATPTPTPTQPGTTRRFPATRPTAASASAASSPGDGDPLDRRH
jgi:serine/threonine-protein kinase